MKNTGHKLANRRAPDGHGARHLLDRIPGTHDLAQAIPGLPPALVYEVIQGCGLEDCAELVALVTPRQLTEIFDLDLWTAGAPGADERFDADRFGLWLEVLAESGPELAAGKLAHIDAGVVIAGLARHVRVFDRAALTSTEGRELLEPPGGGATCDLGGYVLSARRDSSWDAIVSVVSALAEGHPDFFQDVMRGCRAQSNSRREADGLDELLAPDGQALLDCAVDREERRAKQGYAPPGQARAFLDMARHLDLSGQRPPAANPLAEAYFRSMDRMTAGAAAPPAARAVEGPVEADGPVRAVRSAPDPFAHSARLEELAYLANTMMAGCSLQGRAFTPQEASDAVLATCNLGLENWPPQWTTFHSQDPIATFQVGWTVLHRRVSMYAAERLLLVLQRFRSADREIQAELNALGVEMARHLREGAPWRAGHALEVIGMLDMPAWAGLRGLIAECPVLHAAVDASTRSPKVRAVSPSAFDFVSGNTQLELVRAFMDALPDTLAG